MSHKTNNTQTAQSTANLPTVQEQKDAVSQQLIAIKESVTPEAVEKAARKAGITAKTAREYLKGKVAFLHRGERLYNELLKSIKVAA